MKRRFPIYWTKLPPAGAICAHTGVAYRWGANSAAKGRSARVSRALLGDARRAFRLAKRFVTSTFNERRIRKGAKNMGWILPRLRSA